MKKITLLIFLAISISITSQNQYYYYEGQKQILETVDDYVFVAMKNSLSYKETAEQQVVIKTMSQEDFSKLEKMNNQESCFFKLKIGNSPYSVSIKSLKGKDDIDYITPYFKTAQGDTIALSNKLYVKLKHISDTTILKKYCSTNNLDIIKQDEFMPLWFVLSLENGCVKNTLELANQFFENGIVQTAEPDFIGNFKFCRVNVSDTYWSDQWGLNNTGQYGGTSGIDINVIDAWSIATGQNIRVAIVDRGIQLDHSDLKNNIFGNGYDGITGGNSQIRGNHGTACAGIVGASGNSVGIRGVAFDCKLLSVSIFTSETAAAGINWATNNGADIISNSWSISSPLQLVTDAINNAVTNGRNGLGSIVVFASGNDNSSVSYPASLSQVIAVGAISPCGERKGPKSCDTEQWGSNYGTQLDIVAPGVLIPTTDLTGNLGYNNQEALHPIARGTKISSDYSNRDYTVWFNGTSAACPHVAGVAALVLSVNPNLSAQEARRIIESSAQKIGNYNYSYNSSRPNGSWNNEMGYGLVDAKAAVLKALDLSLSGPDILCPNDGLFSYSVSNVPANATVTWTCSGGASLSGSNTGTSCFVKGTTSGYAHIKAVVNINGTTVELGKNLEIASKSGSPYLSYTSDDRSIYLRVHTPNIYGIRQFIWNATGSSSQSSSTGPAGDYWTLPKGSYNVECRIVTQCGHLLATTTIGGYRSSVYPNPVDQTLHIDITEPEEAESENAIYTKQRALSSSHELRLFNFQGTLVRNMRVTDRQVSIDVSGLPSGNYFLHILRDDVTELEVHKVIISH